MSEKLAGSPKSASSAESPEAAQEMGGSESWEDRTAAKGLASATQPGVRQAAG